MIIPIRGGQSYNAYAFINGHRTNLGIFPSRQAAWTAIYVACASSESKKNISEAFNVQGNP